MKVFLRRLKIVTITFWSLALAGCLGGPSPPANFYMISPLSSPHSDTDSPFATARIHIGLEPVAVPEYLNRNEIVVNLDNTIYQLAEFDKWAEPLSDNLTRVLEENLNNLLQTDSINVFLASESSILFDYRLEVDVLRLDGNLGDQVTLVAQWALLEAKQDELKLIRRSGFNQQAADNTYKELVLAKSGVIEQLCREMAVAIRKTLTN